MTDRRASHFVARVRRATIGRVFPFIRHLRARGLWEWWTATGVIPRWQLLLVYVLVIAAGAVGMASTRDVADRADHAAARANEAAIDAKQAAVKANEAVAGVQQSRIEACREANDRHRNILKETRRQIRLLPAARRAQAEANFKNTRRIIGAIAPMRACKQVVAAPPASP